MEGQSHLTPQQASSFCLPRTLEAGSEAKMSGLEPIAALGLACNILQVIGTGLETVRVAKQVYQDGNLDPALTETARILDDLSSRIRSTTTVASTAKPKAQEKKLFDLAEKCQRASRALCEEVNFLNGAPTKAKLSGAIRTALMTRWRKKRLVKLEQQLKEAESLLQTGLLTTILSVLISGSFLRMF